MQNSSFEMSSSLSRSFRQHNSTVSRRSGPAAHPINVALSYKMHCRPLTEYGREQSDPKLKSSLSLMAASFQGSERGIHSVYVL